MSSESDEHARLCEVETRIMKRVLKLEDMVGRLVNVCGQMEASMTSLVASMDTNTEHVRSSYTY